MQCTSRSPKRIYSKLQECYVCQQELVKDVASSKNCGHVYHYNCILESITKKEECPYCRKGMTRDDVMPLILNHDDIDENMAVTDEWYLAKRQLSEFEGKYEELEEKLGGVKNKNEELEKENKHLMQKIKRREDKLANLLQKFEKSNLMKTSDKLIEIFPHLSPYAKKIMKLYKERIDKEIKQNHKIEFENLPFVGPLMNDSTGEIYEGQYSNCKKQGVGKIFYGDENAFYFGTFYNDKRDGFGIVIKENNSYIIGEWKNNKVCGKALYKRQNGDYYEGQWYNGKKHGSGKELIVGEKIYIGKYINNEKMDVTAKVINQKSGMTYNGSIINGLMQGTGDMNWSNGSIYKGTFCNNMMQGPGMQVDSDGNKFRGNFMDNKRHGEFLKINVNGQMNKAYYRNGNLLKEKSEGDTIVIA